MISRRGSARLKLEALERRCLLAAASGGSISGTAFWDHDADSALEAGEETMVGVTVYIDLNNNRLIEESEPRQVTGAGGVFAFADLAAGTYTLRPVVTDTHVWLPPTPITVADGEAGVRDVPMVATKYFGTTGNDHYTLRHKAQLGETQFEILVDGVLKYTVPANWTQSRTMTFLLGAGDDTLVIDGTNGQPPRVLFDGGDNSTPAGDLLQVQGAISTLSTAMRFADAALPPRELTYRITGLERVTASVAQGAMVCGILSLPAETSVTINGSGGNDTFICGDDLMSPAQRNVDAVDGNITFNGNGGQDVLDYRDDNNTATGLAYVITPNSVSRNDAGTVNYAQVENINLTAGSKAATINLTGNAAGTTVTLTQALSSTGANTPAHYILGPDLSTFLGSVAFNPSFGSTLTVNDLGAGGASYTLGPTTLGRTGINPIPIWNGAGFITITLNGQAGDNAFNILAPLAGSPTLNLNGNDGNDTFTLPAVLPRLNITGGSGSDSLILNAGSGSSALVVHPNRLNVVNAEVNHAGIESLAVNMQSGHDNVTLNGTAPTTAVAIHLGDGNDMLHITAAPSSPLTFAGGLLASDNDTLNVNAGVFTFEEDANVATANLTLNVGGGGAVVFAAPQHLAALNVTGQASISAGGGNMLVTAGLNVTGSLNLADNDLVLDYDSVSPVGIWTGSAYDGVTGMVQSGKVVTSTASGNLKKLAVAEARDALAISGSQTGTFSDQPVDSTAVLVKFTWGGDANLDGRVNIDDYGRIDANVSQSGSVWGWFNGDFNYDGLINIDDYGIIDGNVSAQDGIL